MNFDMEEAMSKKRQNPIHIVFLLVMLIVSGFFNGMGCGNSNNDSEIYADQLRALHEDRAMLYQNLESHFGQYWAIKSRLRDAENAYEKNRSSENLERLDAFTLEGQKLLERIEALTEEIDRVENNVIPIVKGELSEKASDDSNFKETIAIINGIKSKLNQFLGQYPEIDAIIGDTLKQQKRDAD